MKQQGGDVPLPLLPNNGAAIRRPASSSCLRSVSLVELLFEQRAKLGRTGGSGCVVDDGLLYIFLVLCADRERQLATLAIHASELGFDLVAHLQMQCGIFDALLGDVVGTQVTLDALAQIDHSALGVNFLDRAIDDA